MTDGRRIVLGEDDFKEDPASAARQAPLAPAQPLAPAGPVLPAVTRGAPRRVEATDRASAAPGEGARWLSSPSRELSAAAVLGVFLAWGLTELIDVSGIKTTSRFGSEARAGLYVGLIGLTFGGTIICFDWLRAHDWETAWRKFYKAAVPLFAASFVAGFLAEVVYAGILEGISVEEFLRITPNNLRFYLARAIGWALFGAAIGGIIGLVNRSPKQAINGTIGGLAGGALGGIIFQFAEANLGFGEALLRLLGLLATGILIGVGMRLVETARREAWLQVIAGGMAGKEFILYHPVTQIGSSPDCEIYLLKDPAVEKFHARIDDEGARRTLTALGQASVLVNNAPTSNALLRSGDQIQIGGTTIAYSERPEMTA